MRQMRQMKSMELSDEDKLDSLAVHPMVRPDHPPGLRIHLTEKEFEKLDCDPSVAEVDCMVEGRFCGRITHVSHAKHENGEDHRVEIQIEDLCLECEDEENEEEE
jgi:hypothetical protein